LFLLLFFGLLNQNLEICNKRHHEQSPRGPEFASQPASQPASQFSLYLTNITLAEHDPS
jgi:hypothetical protein